MTTNTHTRACPKCGKIVSWTFGKPQGKYNARPAKLICPKHGEFRNHAEIKLMERLNK